MKAVLSLVFAVVALAAPGVATAAPPVLLNVGQERRHPTAAFSAPRAESVTIYVATKPDRATDGSFLDENVESLDFLVESEIAAGRWLSESQLDPGTYYVALRASPNFEACWDWERFAGLDPACADGFSNVLTLTVPAPRITYRGTATKNLEAWYLRVDLTLRSSPVGNATVPYRVCWRQPNSAGRLVNRCVRRRLVGFGWDTSPSDSVTVNGLPMLRRTTFSWFVGSRRVAQRTLILPKD